MKNIIVTQEDTIVIDENSNIHLDLNTQSSLLYPKTISYFLHDSLPHYQNQIIYNIESLMDYKQAILDYISGMSDNYAIKAYSELIEF